MKKGQINLQFGDKDQSLYKFLLKEANRLGLTLSAYCKMTLKKEFNSHIDKEADKKVGTN
jgi:hypothetical protein